VSPDSPAESKGLEERLGIAHIKILSDPDLKVTDTYALRHVGGRSSTGEDKPYPTTFIVDGKGVIAAKFENQTYRDRPDPGQILDAARTAASSPRQRTDNIV
jgi:peroxiredoxin